MTTKLIPLLLISSALLLLGIYEHSRQFPIPTISYFMSPQHLSKCYEFRKAIDNLKLQIDPFEYSDGQNKYVVERISLKISSFSSFNTSIHKNGIDYRNGSIDFSYNFSLKVFNSSGLTYQGTGFGDAIVDGISFSVEYGISPTLQIYKKVIKYP